MSKPLGEELDDLYEAYLQLLDSYTLARAQLATQMSAGFLSLAQANFDAPHRQRFGQDHYDQRMKATSHIALHSGEHDHIEFDVRPRSAPPIQSISDASAERAADASPKRTRASTIDPINWFGILVPHSLRSSQKHFVAAMEQGVYRLASLDSHMKALEIEIRRTKKRMAKLE